MIKSLNCNLRPHHSLCIQFFVGKGYSQEFITAMTETVAMLNEKNPLITLSRNCDMICAFCPHQHGGKCTSDCKVHHIDKRCLEKYQLHFGDKIFWLDLKQLAFETIINQNQLQNVCQDCQWYPLCENRRSSEKWKVENDLPTATLTTNH